MTKSEAKSSSKPYSTATSPEKHYSKQLENTITTCKSTESQELAGTLANTTSHRSSSRGGGGAEEGLDPDPQRGGRENVIPDFKNKIIYAPYVSLRSQSSHIATNKG